MVKHDKIPIWHQQKVYISIFPFVPEDAIIVILQRFLAWTNGFQPILMHSKKKLSLQFKDEPEKPQIHTVFFGGGTPSIIPAYEYERILEVVRSSFTLEDRC